MKVLLVEPDFPIPKKSRNHKDFLPIGLLKIGAYLKHRRKVRKVELVRGNVEVDFHPDEIYITSLFTYWSSHFWECVAFYRNRFSEARIKVGGIYVSLLFDDPNFRANCNRYKVKPHRGVFKSAERYKPDYSLINLNPRPLDYQIVHASRGCPRRCSFCGGWKIEPTFEYKKSIKNLICFNKIVFYDNNLLANPAIENILKELAEMKLDGKPIICESQSGFDGSILEKKPYLAYLLKKARFVRPKVAWDGRYDFYLNILRQIEILENAGYKRKKISIFMLFNWEIPFKEMEMKRVKCWEWKAQIADCRFRPLNQLFDYFDAKKSQTSKDYFIHPKWTDLEVKIFRKNVRRQNICVRHGFQFYSRTLEKMKVSKKRSIELRYMSKNDVRKILSDAWFPDEIRPPKLR